MSRDCQENELIGEIYGQISEGGLGIGSGQGLSRGVPGRYDPDAQIMTGSIEDIANEISGLQNIHMKYQDDAIERMKMSTRGFLGKNPQARDQVREMLQGAIGPDKRSPRFSDDDIKEILGERPQGPTGYAGHKQRYFEQ
tara:strand:+ start:986 stop:1405 length:420 start_codon:yes stop_codon:yes gene_type:complete